jgi:hypothetical protein
MAKTFPEKFPHSDDEKRWAEQQVFDKLKTLDDQWMVFYSVAWQSERFGKEGDGEADFVLVHPEKGIFTVEVKGGSLIELVDGSWYTHSRRGRHALKQSPFAQAVDSKTALRRYLSTKVAGFRDNTPLGHFVVFPSHEQEGDLGADGPRAIICDKRDLENIGKTIHSIASHWNLALRLNPKEISEVRQALAPTVQLRRLLKSRVEDINRELLQMTESQISAMRMLRHYRKYIVTGSAGTGKTLLALARARQLQEDGFKTLLICYNQQLGKLLRAEVEGSGILAGSFHSICFDLAQQAGMIDGAEESQEWWDTTLPAMLPDAAFVKHLEFDAIVIDEAQDMHPEWWDYLKLLFDNDDAGVMSVFADSNQDLYRQGWLPPFQSSETPLDQNCRNTLEIASQVNRLMPDAAPAQGVNGVTPTFKEESIPEKMAKAALSSIAGFIRDGKLSPSQIAVICTRREDVELVARGLGDINASGVTVDTIHRFKGLESDAVIVMLHEMDVEEIRRLAYVGMSRARAVLHVVGSAAVRAKLNWDGSA